MPRRLTIAVLTFVALGSAVHAQTKITENTLRLSEGAAAPAASIEDLAWLAGAWHGDGLGGQVQETWTAPAGGTMMGSFKLVQEGKPSFYEFLLILPKEDSLVMKLKHFHPDFIGWEEKEDFVTFPLVKVGENEVFFRGLTLRRSGNELRIFLALHRDGEVSEMPFVLQRSDT